MKRGANTESLTPDTFCLVVSGEPLCGVRQRKRQSGQDQADKEDRKMPATRKETLTNSGPQHWIRESQLTNIGLSRYGSKTAVKDALSRHESVRKNTSNVDEIVAVRTLRCNS